MTEEQLIKLAVAIAAALGIGNLLLAIYNRRSSRQDAQDELHEANRGKELDANSGFQERLIHRVESLEAEIKEMRIEQLAQARINERLTVENDGLKRVNLRQEAEIKELQDTVHRLEIEISASRTVYADLEMTRTLLAECESREPLGIDTANQLREEAASIIENIKPMSFVPTGPPTEADKSAIRRLKEIRDSAEKMKLAIAADK